jgi:hypothetical protein
MPAITAARENIYPQALMPVFTRYTGIDHCFDKKAQPAVKASNLDILPDR